MYTVRRFEGKNAIITGASSGMGQAAAERLASEGAQVFLVARREDKLAEVAEGIRKAGAKAHTCVADVSKRSDVNRFVQEALTAFDGKIDVLINNAGVFPGAPFLEITDEAWDNVMDINLKGMFMVGQAVATEMARTGGGAIVNVSSINGIVGESDDCVAHYAASKGGVSLLTRQMAIELAKHNIRVNAVCPGTIDTAMVAEWKANQEMWDRYINTKVPMRRAGTPAEVAALHAFLASDDSSYITGELIVIDGGMLAF